MPNRFQMRDLPSVEGSGTWVSADQYGSELPAEDSAKFVLQHHKKGTWGIAIRGYNDGERMTSLMEGSGEVGVVLKDNVFPAVESLVGVIPVDDETGEKYLEAVKQPETTTNLLVQVLEQRASGIWSVQAPAEYNNYEAFAHLHIGEAGLALAWGKFTQSSETPESDSQFYRFDEVVPATLNNVGPLYYVKPADDSVRGLSSSALTERTRDYPDLVSLFGEIPTIPSVEQYAGQAAVSVIHEQSEVERLYGR